MNPKPLIGRLIFAYACWLVSATAGAQSISGVINSYYSVTGVNVVPNTITVSSSAGLSPGIKVLIIQMKGATINSTNTASFGNITALNNAGNYEFNYICGISGNNLLLQYELLRSYDVSGSVQLIPVPQYNSVTVIDTVKAASWNAATGTGGVIVLEARDTLFMNSVIDASGKGFTGGALLNNTNCVWSTNVMDYTLPAVPADPNTSSSKKGEGIAAFITNGDYGRGKQANGGGGGNNHNTGGAGGSNYGTGGNGGIRSNETFFQCHGSSPGVGGLTLSTFGYTIGNNRIYMGGGGGAGHQNNSVGTPGGHGGGIIIILANTIYYDGGRFLANGGAPYNPACANPLNAEGDGGGGGGAGGTIALNVGQIVNGKISAEVKGAKGSGSGWATNNCVGPGGGGGGGVIWVSNAALLPNIADSIAGGGNGTISPFNSTPACQNQANGATAGTAGATLTGYVPPLAGNFICAPLPVTDLLSFRGKQYSGQNQLTWTMRSTGSISSYEVERSSNSINFTSVVRVSNTGRLQMDAFDQNPPAGNNFYRLKINYLNGEVKYSTIVSIQKATQGFDWMALYPNPASSEIRIVIVSGEKTDVILRVHNQVGQVLIKQRISVRPGHNMFPLTVSDLGSGLYAISLETKGNRLVRKLIVQQPGH